jgi:hypothetical protein
MSLRAAVRPLLPPELLDYHRYMLEALRALSRQFDVVVEVGRIKQLYRLRHWLAHGRYFTNRSGVQHDPPSAFYVIEEFIRAIHAADPDFPRRPRP